MLLVVLVLTGSTAAVAAPSVRPGADRAGSPELQRALDQVVAAGAPGALALVTDGAARVGEDRAGGHEARARGAVETVASGVADVRIGRPMRPGDRFRAASVTKSMLATVVLQLVAERRLSLSDTLERWLPGILAYGDRITVRQLLNHTSGVPDYEAAVMAGLYAGDRFRSWRPRDLVALVADQPPDFPAGSARSYSNTGYVLLGLIIERVTGQRLGRELERRIFRPLGMHDTSAPTNFPLLVGRHANGYSLRLDDQLNPIEGTLFDITIFNPSLAWAAGNVVSDVEDLARFFRGLLGGRLLPPALLADMKTPVDQTPGEASYGLGLIVAPSPCGPLFGHDGGIPGFTNFILSSEDGTHQFAVMVNANAAPAAVQEPFALLIEKAFQEAFAGEPCASATPQTQPALLAGGAH
jgi:D-alanyl-D-alanine carboxypeptidase